MITLSITDTIKLIALYRRHRDEVLFDLDSSGKPMFDQNVAREISEKIMSVLYSYDYKPMEDIILDHDALRTELYDMPVLIEKMLLKDKYLPDDIKLYLKMAGKRYFS